MLLRNVNLNLLPVLQALLQEGSVSEAAARLAMSQSAASEALAKLRATLDDPILVRVGGRMQLTPRAAAMQGPLDDLCRSLDTFLQRPDFDAANAERSFVIACGDYVTTLVAPKLLRLLRLQAPNVTLRFINGGDNLAAGLAAREIDFAIIPNFFVDEFAPLPLRYRDLFRDRAVAVFDASHPLAAKASVTQADLSPYRMIAFHPSAARIERQRLNTFTGGKPFNVSTFVPEVSIVPFLLRGSLDVSIIPARFREGAQQFPDIVDRPLAFTMAPLLIGLAWSPIQDADVSHRWLREAICSLDLT